MIYPYFKSNKNPPPRHDLIAVVRVRVSKTPLRVTGSALVLQLYRNLAMTAPYERSHSGLLNSSEIACIAKRHALTQCSVDDLEIAWVSLLEQRCEVGRI